MVGEHYSGVTWYGMGPGRYTFGGRGSPGKERGHNGDDPIGGKGGPLPQALA